MASWAKVVTNWFKHAVGAGLHSLFLTYDMGTTTVPCSVALCKSERPAYGGFHSGHTWTPTDRCLLLLAVSRLGETSARPEAPEGEGGKPLAVLNVDCAQGLRRPAHSLTVLSSGVYPCKDGAREDESGHLKEL